MCILALLARRREKEEAGQRRVPLRANHKAFTLPSDVPPPFPHSGKEKKSLVESSRRRLPSPPLHSPTFCVTFSLSGNQRLFSLSPPLCRFETRRKKGTFFPVEHGLGNRPLGECVSLCLSVCYCVCVSVVTVDGVGVGERHKKYGCTTRIEWRPGRDVLLLVTRMLS